MKALILNCTLKPSPARSSTEALAMVMAAALQQEGCETEMIRVADKKVAFGVVSEAINDTDQWPELHQKILDADILIMASPTWLGHPASIAQLVLERLDGMISEKKPDGRPAAYDKVAGVVVTGNEDGAHHVISEICGALGDIGFTIPAQAWTYWNIGPGPGKDYIETDEGHDWSKDTAESAAKNIVSVARALAAYPISQ